jgi:hypothetical protein
VSVSETTPPTCGAEDRQELLDFLVTQEQFGVAAVSAAIERAEDTPSAVFIPVLRSAVTAEYHHVIELEQVGANAFTSRFWIPDAAFGDDAANLFATLEAVETIEVSMYGVGVDTFARDGDAGVALLCARALGVEAVHRALARFAQAQLGSNIGVPNDVGFENLDWPTLQSVRSALEGLGISYAAPGTGPGAFYEYAGDPVASGVGTPVTHPTVG